MRELSSHVYEKIVAAFPVGVFIVGGDGVICEWNTWLVSCTDITKEQALGQCLNDLFPRENIERFQFAVEQVLCNQNPQILSQVLNHYLIPIPLKHVVQRDEVVYMQQAVSLYPITEGEKTYALVVIKDVTENYNQRQALLRMAKK